MKEFNIKLAKQGKPVCTRDGHEARIICFDAKGDAPIVALITIGDGEFVRRYWDDGTTYACESVDDLMMLPEKKEGWVCLLKSDKGFYLNNNLFSSKEQALKKGGGEFSEVVDVKHVEFYV